jgi:probable F420-dependent oxidoreductase
MAAMRFGLTAFCTDTSLSPAEVAAAAEAEGFDVVLFPDHTHVPVERRSPYPGGGDLPEHYKRTYDPIVACSYAATATTTIRVGIGVCLVPAREPIALAKQLASIDVLSGGRLVVGVGAGWNVEEIADHGVAAADRWAVLEERTLAIQAIWAEDEASFRGAHVSFGPIWSWPKPVQQPHPPVLVGGYGPGVLKRVVAYGDEWLAMVAPGRPPLRDRIAELGALADAAGRPPIPVSVQAYGAPPPDQVIERCIDAGADRIDFGLPHGVPDAGRRSLAELGEVIRRYA